MPSPLSCIASLHAAKLDMCLALDLYSGMCVPCSAADALFRTQGANTVERLHHVSCDAPSFPPFPKDVCFQDLLCQAFRAHPTLEVMYYTFCGFDMQHAQCLSCCLVSSRLRWHSSWNCIESILTAHWNVHPRSSCDGLLCKEARAVFLWQSRQLKCTAFAT